MQVGDCNIMYVNEETIAQVEKALNKLKAIGIDEIDISEIQSFPTDVKINKQDVNKAIKTKFGNELSLIALGIFTIAQLQPAIGIHQHTYDDKDESRFFVILDSYLSHLINYAMSIVRLVNDGFDNPARSLVRVHMELVWQLIILCSSDKHMREWVGSDSPEESTKTWNRLFRGKMNSKLEKLEREFGLSSDISNQLASNRRGAFKFYSQAVHHSFDAIFFGNFCYSIDNDDQVTSGVSFGVASNSLGASLEALIDTILYFFLMFPKVIESHSYVNIDQDNQFWRKYFSMVVIWLAVEKRISGE